MTTGILRNLVLARAIAVEPIARALCADPVDARTTPLSQTRNGRRAAARRPAQSARAAAAYEAAVEADDPDLP